MARRSPGNARYRKDAQIGKTRRSAASAKPKRDAGEVPPAPTSNKSGSGSSEPKKGRFFEMLPTPDTPEFRKMRTIWLVLFVIGASGTAVALYFRDSMVGNVALGVAYIFLFGAILMDMLKIRPMRREYAEKLKQGGKK